MNTPSKEALEASGYIVRSLGITEEDRGLLASIIDRHFEPLRQRTEQAEARVKELQKQEAESRRLFYSPPAMSTKVPTEILRKRIELLTLEQLREFAYDVAFLLYGVRYYGAKQGDEFLDQETEWTQEHIENVDDYVRGLRLHPSALEQDFDTGSLDDSTNDSTDNEA